MDCYDPDRQYQPIIQRPHVNVPWASHGKIANNFIWLAIGFVVCLALVAGWR